MQQITNTSTNMNAELNAHKKTNKILIRLYRHHQKQWIFEEFERSNILDVNRIIKQSQENYTIKASKTFPVTSTYFESNMASSLQRHKYAHCKPLLRQKAPEHNPLLLHRQQQKHGHDNIADTEWVYMNNIDITRIVVFGTWLASVLPWLYLRIQRDRTKEALRSPQQWADNALNWDRRRI